MFLIFIAEIILFIIFALIFGFYEKITIHFVKKKSKLYLNANKANRERIQDVFNKYFDTYLTDFKFTVLILSIFVLPFMSNLLILFPTFLIYFIYYTEKVSTIKTPKLMLSMVSVIIIISTIVTTLVNSYNKRFEKDEYIISFNENSTFISTDTKVSCYNYLGETSTNIFLYDIENKESKIFFKDNISNIQIKNNNEIDEYLKRIKENFIVKTFIEMITRKK